MAAPMKKGLDYYPRDVNLMTDRKFRKPKMKYGYLAIVIYEALLELIYGDEGYYIRYSDSHKDDVAWDILDRIRGKYNVEAETIYEVIEMLVECELFSGYHYKQGVITSKRIQKIYYKSTVERKNVDVDKKIWFLTIPEMEAISIKSNILSNFINQPINEDNQTNNEDNQSNNSESKVNKSKVNKSKVECVDGPPTLEEINRYCRDNQLNYIDAERFYSYYTSKNWKGVQDWKARAKYWNTQDKDKSQAKQINNAFNNYTQEQYTDEQIEEILRRKNNE